MQIRQNVSLKRYNSFGIEAAAKYFTSFSNVDELREILSHSQLKKEPQKLVLGGGSNILFTKDVDGLVLKNEITGIEVVREDDAHIYLKAGAGENWHGLVMFCVENGYAGMENLALIPGNAGASPMQNIGAYGVEIKDVFHEAEAYHRDEHIVQKFSLDDCAFGYRESVFKHKYKNRFVLTSVTYRLNKQPQFQISYGAIQQELNLLGVQHLTIAAVAQAVINIRSSKLPNPAEVGNAGSFFKNPAVANEAFEALRLDYPTIPHFPFDETHVKVPAGWLIEQCGWKGYRKGNAGCYPKQALVLVNYGAATGNEIFDLSEEILQSVKSKFGIALEREVNLG